MQGLIFNLLGERVSEIWHEGYWRALVADTPGLDSPVFVGPKNYPDDALMSLLIRISADHGIAMDRLLVDFGRRCFPRLAAAHPVFMVGHEHAYGFIETVEDVVHTEVRKLYDEAYLPSIHFERPDPTTLVAIYRSRRRLCWLAEGLIQGVGEYFDEPVSTLQDACVHEGASECRIRITFGATE